MSLIAYALAVSTSPARIMPADTAENPSLLALLAYWGKLRGADVMPGARRAQKRDKVAFLNTYICATWLKAGRISVSTL